MDSKKTPTKQKTQERKQRGGIDSTVMFPVASSKAELPADYNQWVTDLKQRIHSERLRVVLASNAAMVVLYWEIGRSILEKQQSQGWGKKIIDRLSFDLREQFPEMKGFSPRNLGYMKAFAAAWPDSEILQRSVAKLSWRHNITLLEKLKTQEERLWYAMKAYEFGWSYNILAMQIEVKAHLRLGKAQNNFLTPLPPEDSDYAVQVFKDPYLFDFLGTDAPRREKELEQGLIDHVQKFLLELGQGFAFVGRQVSLVVDGREYFVDLLFYHLKLRRFIILEIKAREFDPKDISQINFYMSAVDDHLRHAGDEPTIGMIFCKTKQNFTVEYALRDFNKPIGVAGYEVTLVESLSKELKESLPTVEDIEAEFGKDKS